MNAILLADEKSICIQSIESVKLVNEGLSLQTDKFLNHQ